MIELFGSTCCQSYRCWVKTFKTIDKALINELQGEQVDVEYLKTNFGIEKQPFVIDNGKLIENHLLVDWYVNFIRSGNQRCPSNK